MSSIHGEHQADHKQDRLLRIDGTHGTLTITSPTGEGVQFSLSLPVAVEYEPGSEQEEMPLE